ncbi:TadE/TadG family type IV pilus assembly protein [Nitratireductor sp. ZSWI3]|uniref:TadE/TadG family type IV pilus assembly protein n=1 Tax=Nitratireductor sp. ZSWI3 TaxID=2966359 RepID=UPI00214F7C75|nr:TadE/TadG family type IV pilus assembly protein [Nitratireductor sp. ZSWI3]MCR4266010.1 pilus assembly protein [Nitratireductor sp. ZSWI3]
MQKNHSLRFLNRTDGAAALEFAIIAPVFFLTVFSMIAYGIYLGAAHSVQQLSADAARAAVAGLSQSERQSLAENFIEKSTMHHPFIDAHKLKIAAVDDATNPNQFTVTLKYDARDLPIWSLYSYAMPGKEITGFSTIRLGGM